jgi:flagellar secretion chaperone FliS
MNARLSYREAAVEGASPVRLVILLYEQAFEDLRAALGAHQRGDIEGRTGHINHAILVIGYLQASLDKERGGRVAVNLERFYDQVRSGLVEAQFKQSGAALEQQISHLMQVHEAWCEVERINTEPVRASRPALPENTTATQTLSPLRSSSIFNEEQELRPSSEWNA